MKKVRNLLIAGSIISFLMMLFYFFIDLKVIYIMFLISTLISFYLYNSEDNILINNRWLLLVLAIPNTILCIPISIIYFIAHDKLSDIYKIVAFNPDSIEKNIKKEIIPPENKKIDILMKFGVFLVVLSGIIFSTSITNTKLDIIKPLFVLLLCILFKALSYFFKHKVIIKSSEKIYSILSDIFIVCFVISLGYFQTLGNYLSFFGEGKLLMGSIVSLVLSYVILNLEKKTNITVSKEISLGCIFLSILLLLLHLNLEYIYITGIFSIISLLIYYFKSKLYPCFNNINSLINIVVLISYFVYYKDAFSNNNFNFVFILVGVVLIYYLYLRTKNNNKNQLLNKSFPILSTIFVLVGTYYLGNYINSIKDKEKKERLSFLLNLFFIFDYFYFFSWI